MAYCEVENLEEHVVEEKHLCGKCLEKYPDNAVLVLDASYGEPCQACGHIDETGA